MRGNSKYKETKKYYMKSNSHQQKFQEVWGAVLKQTLTPQTLNLQVDIDKFIVTLQRENVH